jgi:hypothetical protein
MGLRVVCATTAVVACAGAWAAAAELTPPTIAAFDHYVELTEARMAGEVAGAAPLLWIDRQRADARIRLITSLKAGQVDVEKLETRDRGESIRVPDGLIHHWMGTVWIPGASLEGVISFVQDYAGYPAAFGPLVRSARVTAHEGDRFDVAMRTETHKVITVVVDATYRIDYTRIDARRVLVKTVASDLKEIENAGTLNERAVAAEHGRGYVWRMNTYCAFESQADGTFEQCESISLSRGLPFGIGWMIEPFVTSVPKETLEFTLGHVRQALIARAPDF